MRHGPGPAQALEKGAVRDRVDAPFGPRADVSRKLVARSVRVDDVDRGVGDPARVLERRQHPRHQIAHVDDVHQVGAQVGHPAGQLVLFLKQPAGQRPFDPGAQRIEHDQDRGRRDQGVEEEQLVLLLWHPFHQSAINQGHDEDQGCQHHHASQQLVQVEQAVADEGLRKEEQIDGDEDVRERRPPGLEHEVQQGKRDGRDPAHHQVQQPDLFHPRRRGAVAAVQVPDRRIQSREDVEHEGRPEPGTCMQWMCRADEVTRAQRQIEDHRADHRRTRQRRRPGLVAEEGLKEPLRRCGQRNRRQHGGPAKELGVRGRGEERKQLQEGDVERKCREQDVSSAARFAQQHRSAYRETHDGGDQRRQGLGVEDAQSPRSLTPFAAPPLSVKLCAGHYGPGWRRHSGGGEGLELLRFRQEAKRC